ncbi:MAG: hypothetical protein AAF411_00010 [Myxococcota bacterium]
MRILLALSAASMFLACSASPGVEPCTTDTECGSGTCVDGRCIIVPPAPDAASDTTEEAGPMPDLRVPSLTSLRIEPASADLVAALGERPTAPFQAIGTFEDGSEVMLSAATFVLESTAIGDIDADGLFTANGAAGGVTTITAEVPGVDAATATVSVRIEQTIGRDTLTLEQEAAFAAPTAAADATERVAQLLYPLDGAVMPQNVFPADLQWGRGAAGDVYRVVLEKPSFTLTVYTVADERHYLVDRESWEAIARTEPSEDASVRVDRFDGAGAVLGTPRTLRFASAALTGSVYYWDIAAGEILRINDGSGEAESFMPTPPFAQRQSPGEGCVGCHTVSNSGRFMAGRLGGGENIGGVFDLTSDLTVAEPPTVFPLVREEPSSARWWFSTWSPDDSRLAISTTESNAAADGVRRALRLLDPLTGLDVPFTGTAPTDVTHPSWSPDGTQIAFASATNNWGGAFTAANIGLVDITGDAFGAITTIHEGASLSGSGPGGVADSYPTWTPDSARIAFSHGTGTRSEDQNAALYIMNRDGTNVVPLTAAASAGNTDFQPRFSPFQGGGFFWMSFLSRRDYGNDIVGTQGDGLQQIWVTAIRTDAAAGEDPSSVPFWLPGQRTTTRNISAYWAPRPCRDDGEACGVGSECCGGDCRPDGDGVLVCSPPPPEQCRRSGETCSSADDCCEGLSCEGRVCIPPVL